MPDPDNDHQQHFHYASLLASKGQALRVLFHSRLLPDCTSSDQNLSLFLKLKTILCLMTLQLFPQTGKNLKRIVWQLVVNTLVWRGFYFFFDCVWCMMWYVPRHIKLYVNVTENFKCVPSRAAVEESGITRNWVSRLLFQLHIQAYWAHELALGVRRPPTLLQRTEHCDSRSEMPPTGNLREEKQTNKPAKHKLKILLK